MKVLVYGLGRSGGAVSRLLRAQDHEVWIYDRAPQRDELEALQALGCRVAERVAGLAVELCVAAPGVPWDHPELQALRARGTPTIGEVEWVFRSVAARFIGITGTAGKGTVTSWLTQVLRGAGLAAHAGGNIDPALAEVALALGDQAERLFVTELSSFMLERCPSLKPEVAVLLNLGVDHLDRHGSVVAYHAAKKNLLKNLDEACTLVYNADDPILRTWAATSPARVLAYSLTGPADAHLMGGWLYLNGDKLIETGALAAQGKHNHGNALATALAANALGVAPTQIAAGLPLFAGLPGRYSLVGEVTGMRFIEDSIATRSLAVAAALEASPAPVVWIGGGQDKGADFAPLVALVEEKVALFIGIGTAGPAFAEAVSGLTRTAVVREASGPTAMRRACELALAFGRREGLEGATVLLSPLAASFDQFEDYRARARAFREAVRALAAAQREDESPEDSAKAKEAAWI